MDFGDYKLPTYPVPDGYSEQSYLHELCEQGIVRRYGEQPGAEVRERLDFELGVINEMGFDAYFLIVWDYVKYAKDNGIAVGPGRGSAAGSIVSYALGITDIDPLKYDLLFERFLNPGRKSMPDIDMDFSVARREEVIDYVAQKYGRDRVAQIITFGTMAARAAARDAARVLGLPYAVGDKIAKMIPEQAPPATFSQALKGGELKQAYEDDAQVKEVVDLAMSLEGLIRNDSIHAAAVVISDKPLTEYLPLQQKGDAELVTQFDMNDVAKLGLLKMDFLGLRNLDVIEAALAIIEKTDGVCIEIDRLPLDDEKTYKMLARGDASGVFQFESAGMREALRDIGPHAVRGPHRPRRPVPARAPCSSSRPTPATRRTRPRWSTTTRPCAPSSSPRTASPSTRSSTWPSPARWAASARPRRTTCARPSARRTRSSWPRLKEPLMAGLAEKGVPPAVSHKMWSSFEATGDYSFNKSHAACYALISYRTAWLKANYPVEYMAALISSVMNTKDKVPFYVNQCHEMGIDVLPPDVNESDVGFTVVDGKIRFGLNAVKGVGVGAIEAIVAARAEAGPFASVYDFCARVDSQLANKRTLEALIKSGAFDSTGDPAARHAGGAAPGRGRRRAAAQGQRPGPGRAVRRLPRRTMPPPRARACRSASTTRPRCCARRRRPWACTCRRIRCRACAASSATRSRCRCRAWTTSRTACSSGPAASSAMPSARSARTAACGWPSAWRTSTAAWNAAPGPPPTSSSANCSWRTPS